MPEKCFYDRLLESGYPESDIYNHCSDLYIFVTPTTRALVSQCLNDGTLMNRPEIFTDQVTRRPMYDLAFAYIPWWDERMASALSTTNTIRRR